MLCARDRRTTLGKNIAFIENLMGKDLWETSAKMVRNILVLLETDNPPPEDTWRLKNLEKPMIQREELHRMGMEEEKGELQELINSLCTS